MATTLLVALVLLDLGLFVAILYLSKRQGAQGELIEELTEERRLLSELRSSIQEELEIAQGKARQAVDKVTRIATEAEQEVRAGSATIATEMDGVVTDLTKRFEAPMEELGNKQSYLNKTIQDLDKRTLTLSRLVGRGEKICRFFNKNIPYEELMSELEDKKYTDARMLLAKGLAPDKVAEDLGMSIAEVRLVAGLTT